MDNLTPAQKVRLQLEKSITYDAQSRAIRDQLFKNAPQLATIGPDGRIKMLSGDDAPAEFMPNLYYGQGEIVDYTSVQGGLGKADKKSFIGAAEIAAIEPDIPDTSPAFFLGLFYEVLITYTGGSTLTSFDSIQGAGYNLEGDYIPVTEREEVISSDDIDYAYTGEAIFRNSIPYLKYAIVFENTSIGITLGRGVTISFGTGSPLLTASTFAIATTITGYIKIEGFPEESTPPVNWTFDETSNESPQIFTSSYAVGAIPFEVWVNIEINSITFS
jgi:hypothetical protein